LKNKYLYITVFFSGMTALAVELSAARLIGNVYGSSNLVWASVIGLILIYLTLGYWLGGKIADKNPDTRTFYEILMWASFSVGLIPLLSRPILRFTAAAFEQMQTVVIAGAFVTVLILFIVPVTLVGMISPFALKLALKNPEKAGKVSGKLSAVSTMGSFLGTFLPVLVLIPLIGTYRTFLFFSSLLLFIAVIGYIISSNFKTWLRFSWMPVVLILLWIFGTRGADKLSKNMIFETESSYNYIQVIEEDAYRFLFLNDAQAMHSIYHPEELNYGGPWSQVLAAPFFNAYPHLPESVERMAIIGLAGGTTARQATLVFEDIMIDGFEIDPKVVEVGRKYFGMTQPNLNVHIEDGRWGLNHINEDFDIISVDAYRPPYIPWHMTTIEFFKIVSDHLTEDGVLVINIGRSPLDRTLVNDLSTTVAEIFPSIFIMDLPDSFNSVLFATKQPGSWEDFALNYNMLFDKEADQLLLEAMEMTILNQQPPALVTQVYTDDHAPIEWVANKLVVDFILAGGMDDLQ